MRLPRILIVEDDWMIALDLERTIEDAIEANVVTAASVEEATSQLDGLDFALLDVDVSDGTTYGLAERLYEEGVPFAFVSGSSPRRVPERLRSRPFVSKPHVPAAVIALLHEWLGIGPAQPRHASAGAAQRAVRPAG